MPAAQLEQVTNTNDPAPAVVARRLNWSVSAVFVAFCLLVAVDLAFGHFHPLKSVKTVGLDRGEPFNATSAVKKGFAADASDLRKGKAVSEVILLGSSLVVAPSLQSEAAFQGKPLERFNERRLTGFEHYLGDALGKSVISQNASVRSYLLASGGEMASDAYFLEKNVLLDAPDNGQHLAIVYGIGPRDFQDNLFPRVDSSNIFQVLGRVDDLPVVLNGDSKLNFEESGSVCMGRLSALMRYRGDLLRVMTVRSKRAIEALVPGVLFEKYSDSLTLKRQKHGLFPEEAHGTPMVFPNLAIDHNGWSKTNFEYIRRYNPIDKAKSETQFAYFERFLKLAAEKHLNVLVVNMPISRSNRELIPPGFYDQYVARTQELTKQYGFDYDNLNNDHWNNNQNFADSVHLTPEVSKAFMQELAKTVAKSSLSVASVPRGKQL